MSTEHAVTAAAMTRLPAEPLRMDRLVRARAIHSMTGETYRSVGLRGPEIMAVVGGRTVHDPDGRLRSEERQEFP